MSDSQSAATKSRWSRLDTYALLVIVLMAAVLRLWNLSHPNELIFDETYYAKDACWYVLHSESTCARAADAPEVHPPLGKWLIAVGERMTGFDCPNPDDACSGSTTSLGWRIVPALAGTATVALMYLLARRLFRSTLGAVIASGLLAFDFLHLVQSRTSMLDIFVPAFGLAGFYFLVRDREAIDERVGDAAATPQWDLPWRLAAGAAMGAAVATKWSGAYYLVAAVVLTLAWEIAARRRAEGGVRLSSLARALPSVAIYLVIAPFLVYLFTYVGRVRGSLFALPWAPGSWFRTLWNHHGYMLDFHANLDAMHSYQSPPWSWPLLKRPVSYYFCSTDCIPSSGGDYQEIFAAGNPFVWWTSLLALAFVGWRWLRNRDHRRPEGLILVGFLFSYGPWLVSDVITERPAVFIFYLLPAVPFMCLALAYVALAIGRSWEAKAAVGLFAVGTTGVLAFYLPLLLGTSLPVEQWDARIWVFDNCEKPPGDPIVSTVTETVGGNVATRVVETTADNSSVPPEGWCWI